MRESVGVQAARMCPGCGQENSVPLLYGLPGPDGFRLAERGLVVLGGCLMPGDEAAFVCRVCELPCGRYSDPTSDEAGVGRPARVGHVDVVRALGPASGRRPGRCPDRAAGAGVEDDDLLAAVQPARLTQLVRRAESGP